MKDLKPGSLREDHSFEDNCFTKRLLPRVETKTLSFALQSW